MEDEQKILLEMLKDISRIFEENSIRYYVMFGTAIGALRHDGFIPWDNDIDLVIFEEDYARAGEMLAHNLDKEKYYYHVPSADTHSHVIYKGSDFLESLAKKTAPFIDLFAIGGYPVSRVRMAMFDVFMFLSTCMIVVTDGVKSMFLHKAVSKTPSIFRKLAKYVVESNTGNSVVISFDFRKNRFPQGYYGTPIMHRFEDTYVPLPEKIDEMLKSIYGDYMTPPPEDKRCGASGFPTSVMKDYLMQQKEN